MVSPLLEEHHPEQIDYLLAVLKQWKDRPAG